MTPGTNLSYHNPSFIWEMFFRKLGMKPRILNVKSPTAWRNNAADPGTTFPRQIGIAVKYSTTTAPTTNAAADAPTGIGDLCLHVKSNNAGLAHIAVANIDVYRCTVYTSTTVFTWAQIV